MLIYTQLDIPVTVPPTEKLREFILNNVLSKKHNISDGVMCIVSAMVPNDDWRSGMSSRDTPIFDEETKELWKERCVFGEYACSSYEAFSLNLPMYWNPKFEQQFPELKEAVLQMPFKRLISVCLILSATSYDGPLHNDPAPIKDWRLPHNPEQPARYNIALTHFDDPKMYLLLPNGEKQYMKVSKEFPCFVFENKQCRHAVDSIPEGDTRIQLLVAGILDDDKHHDMITRCPQKFPDNSRYYGE